MKTNNEQEQSEYSNFVAYGYFDGELFINYDIYQDPVESDVDFQDS